MTGTARPNVLLPGTGERLAAGPVTHRVLEDGTHTAQ